MGAIMWIETTTFRLRPGTDEETFLEADRRVQTEFVPNLPGFLRRTTARGRDGEWLVLTLWESDRDAEAAAAKGADNPAVAQLLALVDDTTGRAASFQSLD
ncbi:MAG: antibiotic biosynthesis monooxygenase family protein [Acidimicrobiales bacterium]